MTAWEKQREGDGWLHTLSIDEVHTMQISRGAAGDYLIGVYTSGDPCCGELLTEATLPQAKKEAERLIASGEWKNILFEE